MKYTYNIFNPCRCGGWYHKINKFCCDVFLAYCTQSNKLGVRFFIVRFKIPPFPEFKKHVSCGRSLINCLVPIFIHFQNSNFKLKETFSTNTITSTEWNKYLVKVNYYISCLNRLGRVILLFIVFFSYFVKYITIQMCVLKQHHIDIKRNLGLCLYTYTLCTLYT